MQIVGAWRGPFAEAEDDTKRYSTRRSRPDVYEEVTGAAIKSVLSRQIAEATAKKNISKTEMASRMHTSRSALDRLLDPKQVSVTGSRMDWRTRGRGVGHDLTGCEGVIVLP